MMVDREKIKADGIRIIEEFSEQLSGIPESEELHYVIDLKNVKREDGKPVKCEGFKENLRKLAPKWTDGHVQAEKGQ
ncbi:Asp-tRNA(Asn) amidotransferase GatCAB subunit C [Candidatus Altiarchaeota archaeon]